MSVILGNLLQTYLLYPILGLLLVGLGVFIAKKNELLGNKRLVGYAIGAVIVLAIPALAGFLDYDFMPYGYVALASIYLLLGWYNVRMLPWVFKAESKYRHEIILTLFVLINAFKITKARDITTPILLNDFFESALSYDDYCNSRDKTVLTLNQLKQLVCSKN